MLPSALSTCPMTPKNKLQIKLFFKRKLWQYLLVVGSVALCCYLTGKWFEGIAFCFAHCVLRYQFAYQYHSKSFCMQLTNFIIWTAIPTSQTIFVSLLFSIPLAFLVCWIGNEEQAKIEALARYRKLNKEYQGLLDDLSKPKPFSVENCTRDEMIDRCREIGLNAENTELALKFFVERISLWEIAKDLNIEYDSANMRKKRLKKKLL